MKMLSRNRTILKPEFREMNGALPESRRKVTRSVQITIEREVLSVLLHPAGVSFTGRCAACGHEVSLLTAERAAQVAGVTPRAIYRWVESADVHFQETSTGAVFVCSESLKHLGEHGTRLGSGVES